MSSLLTPGDAKTVQKLDSAFCVIGHGPGRYWNLVSKNLATHMQQPKETCMQRLKRLGPYLEGKPRVVQVFVAPHRRADHCVKIMVDSDSAGDLNARRSTVGQVAILGGRVVKHSCYHLQPIGISSSEKGVLRHVGGASVGLGVLSPLRDWGAHNGACRIRPVAQSSAPRRGQDEPHTDKVSLVATAKCARTHQFGQSRKQR